MPGRVSEHVLHKESVFLINRLQADIRSVLEPEAVAELIHLEDILEEISRIIPAAG